MIANMFTILGILAGILFSSGLFGVVLQFVGVLLILAILGLRGGYNALYDFSAMRFKEKHKTDDSAHSQEK